MSRFTVGSAGVRLPGDDPYKMTKFQGMPNLDAQSNAVLITTLELGTKHRVRTS
jgi:hypothetical protein